MDKGINVKNTDQILEVKKSYENYFIDMIPRLVEDITIEKDPYDKKIKEGIFVGIVAVAINSLSDKEKNKICMVENGKRYTLQNFVGKLIKPLIPLKDGPLLYEMAEGAFNAAYSDVLYDLEDIGSLTMMEGGSSLNYDEEKESKLECDGPYLKKSFQHLLTNSFNINMDWYDTQEKPCAQFLSPFLLRNYGSALEDNGKPSYIDTYIFWDESIKMGETVVPDVIIKSLLLLNKKRYGRNSILLHPEKPKTEYKPKITLVPRRESGNSEKGAR